MNSSKNQTIQLEGHLDSMNQFKQIVVFHQNDQEGSKWLMVSNKLTSIQTTSSHWWTMRTINQLVEPILSNKRTIDSMKTICQSRSLKEGLIEPNDVTSRQ